MSYSMENNQKNIMKEITFLIQALALIKAFANWQWIIELIRVFFFINRWSDLFVGCLYRSNCVKMTLLHSNAFSITGTFRGRLTGRRWIPLRNNYQRIALTLSLLWTWTSFLANGWVAIDSSRPKAHAMSLSCDPCNWGPTGKVIFHAGFLCYACGNCQCLVN